MAAMTREDKKRVKKGEALVDKDELIVIAQEEESFLLEFEAEMRAAGQVPEPRLVDPATPDVPRPARPMAERLGNAPVRDIKDRLGTRVEGTPIPETRDCHLCGKVGHIARNCTNKTAASNGTKPSGSRPDPLAAHKTAGHTCETCNKPGHTTAQCWTAHPELIPEALLKKRQQAMAASARKRRRASEHVSPNYKFQDMAYTYKRPLPAMAQRRSARVSKPSPIRETEQSSRRVRFTPTTLPTPTPTKIPLDPATPMVEKEEYTTQLPQTFPHGLPPSSLEPGTTDQQFPPSSLFLDPPSGDGEVLLMETPLQTVAQLRHATAGIQQLVAELAANLWERATDTERRFPVQRLPLSTEEPPPLIPVNDRPSTFYTPAFINNTDGVLDVEGYVPRETIIDTGAAKVMISKSFAIAMGIDLNTLSQGVEFVTASGAVEHPLGVTKTKVMFTLSRGTPNECKAGVPVTIVDTTAYDALLGMEFISAMGGAYDTWSEMFKYRWIGGDGVIRSHEISAPCHATTPPLVAYACFGGLISGEAELHDVQGAHDDIIPPEDDYGFHSSPHQMAAARFQHLSEVCDTTDQVRLSKEVGAHNLARGENAAAKLAALDPLALPTLLPTSKWLGDAVHGAVPINTSVRHLTLQAKRDGLHVLELFGGVGLGVLRTALAAGYAVRCYTYVDRDPTSRRIARHVLTNLQRQYPTQLLESAIQSFDKYLPQAVSLISTLFLSNLVAHRGPVDLLGASWECQSVSQQGAMDPRFTFFYDMVRIINLFQQEQASPLLYILENTYPGEQYPPAVIQAGNLVQAFLGAPILVDAADLGAAAHRVRLFWTNMVQPAILQAALPTHLLPSPSLNTILKPYHIPSKPGHSDQFPFATHKQKGWERRCMPTIVSYLRSNAFRPKSSGSPGEGEVFNLHTNLWEEPDAEEKEELLGFQRGDTAASGVTEAQRAVRLGRALDGTTMRWLGAFLHASQA